MSERTREKNQVVPDSTRPMAEASASPEVPAPVTAVDALRLGVQQAAQATETVAASSTTTPSTTSALSVPKLAYGEQYLEHFLEQYKLAVEMADKVSDRRQSANTYFLTVNTALVAVLGIAWPKAMEAGAPYWFVAVPLAGLLVCTSWYQLLRSYRGLARGKFAVIHAMEAHLPVRLYEAEWKALGEGKDKSKYVPVTSIETTVPLAFIALYALALGGIIVLALVA